MLYQNQVTLPVTSLFPANFSLSGLFPVGLFPTRYFSQLGIFPAGLSPLGISPAGISSAIFEQEYKLIAIS